MGYMSVSFPMVAELLMPKQLMWLSDKKLTLLTTGLKSFSLIRQKEVDCLEYTTFSFFSINKCNKKRIYINVICCHSDYKIV